MKYHLVLVHSALAAIVALPLHAQVTYTTNTAQSTSTVGSTFYSDGTFSPGVATISGGSVSPGGSTSPSGTDTQFLAVSTDPTSNITITFSGPASYFGLLWGSPDFGNTVSFYQGTTLEASIASQDIGSTALPLYPASGTYVNFFASAPANDFTSVVLSDTTAPYSYFEADNLAAAVTSTAAPEIDPASVGSGLALLAGGLLVLRGRQRSSIAAT